MVNIDIRDLRDGKFLWIDKSALNLVSAQAGNTGVAVYSWLCYYANAKHQNCFPSIKTLAEHCNVCRRTVMRTVKDLERIGIVSIERKKGKPNVYKLLNAPVEKSSDTHVTGDADVTGVVTPMSQPVVTPVSPEQELIKQKETNNTVVSFSKLWISSALPYEYPKQKQIEELAVWFVRIKADIDLYRLIQGFRNDKGYPPKPEIVIALCRQFKQGKIRIRNVFGWFKKALYEQMRRYLMDQRLEEHERIKKEPALIGHILSQIGRGNQC